MKWNVMVCVFVVKHEGWDPTATNISDMLYDYPGITDSWFTSKQSVDEVHECMNFTVVADEMPVAKNLFDELNQHFDVNQLEITRECWHLKPNTQFQWTNRGVIVYYDGSVYHEDFWEFRIKGCSVFNILYIPSYTKGWTKGKREKAFGSALYCWVGPAGGKTPLRAHCIDDALKEFEELFENMTRNSIQQTERKLSDLKTELEDLTKWRSKKE